MGEPQADVPDGDLDNQSVRGTQVVQWLLANNYLLTAFELLVEAQEAGKEASVGSLKEFFSDKNKFPIEDVAQFDQDDAVNLQKLAKEREQRLSLAEYELRIAREDLNELQKRRDGDTPAAQPSGQWGGSGPAATPPPAATDVGNGTEGEASASSGSYAAPTLGERQSLNAAVREYLSQSGYKLTAITFVEEAGDPGQAAGRCPLPDMLRAHSVLGPTLEAHQSMEEECGSLRAEMEQLRQDASSAQEAVAGLQKEASRLRADLEYAQGKLDWTSRQLQEAQQAAAEPCQNGSQSSSGHRSGKKPDKGNSGFSMLSLEGALLLVADALPKIVPNVLINKREDLVPLFLALIQEHRDASQRDSLTYALFNIVKKPNAAQRRMITSAFCELARRIGPARSTEELLPQCWEQVGHRHAERRTLVAEACAELAPLVAVEMRASLLLSVLQQLASDEDAGVRQTAAASLARVLPHLPDTDKFSTVRDLLLGLVEDGVHEVVETTFELLLPAMLTWNADASEALLPDILARITSTLTQCPVLGGSSVAGTLKTGSEMRIVGDHQQRQVQVLLRLFIALLPDFQAGVLRQRPEWAVLPPVTTEGTEEPASLSNGEVAEGDSSGSSLSRLRDSGRLDSAHLGPEALSALEGDEGTNGFVPGASSAEVAEAARAAEAAASMARWLTTEEHAQWALLEWTLADCVPNLLLILNMVPPADEAETLRRRLCGAVRATSNMLGEQLAMRFMEPLLCTAATIPHRSLSSDAASPAAEPLPHVAALFAAQTPQSSDGARCGRMCVLPYLLAAVLPAAGPDALPGMLHHLTNPPQPLSPSWADQHPSEVVAALRFTATFEEAQGPLQALVWTFSREDAASARAMAALCAGAIAPCIPASQVMRQVVSALEVLSRDREAAVQSMAIDALAELYGMLAPHKSSARKLQSIFDSISSSGHDEDLAVIWAIAQRGSLLMAGQLQYMLQKALLILASIAQRSTAGRSPVQLKAAASVILQAVRSTCDHEVTEESVRLHLVAALQALQRESELLVPPEQDLLQAMLERVSRGGAAGPLQNPLQRAGSSHGPEDSLRASGSGSEPTFSSGHSLPLAPCDFTSPKFASYGLRPSAFLVDQRRSLHSLRQSENSS